MEEEKEERACAGCKPSIVFPSYFKNAQSERDQEAFLMWLFEEGASKNGNADLKELAKELLWLLSFGGEMDENYRALSLESPENQVHVGEKRIDLVIPFFHDHRKYVLGLEHKVNAELKNPLNEYKRALKDECKDSEIILCVLKPRGLTDSEQKKCENCGARCVEKEFVDLLERHLGEHFFVDDFATSFFPGLKGTAKLETLSRRFAQQKTIIFGSIFSNFALGDDKETKKVTFSKGEKKVIFRINNWENGDYQFYLDAETAVRAKNAKAFFSRTKSGPPEKIVFCETQDNKKLKTVSDLKEMVKRVLNRVSRL